MVYSYVIHRKYNLYGIIKNKTDFQPREKLTLKKNNFWHNFSRIKTYQEEKEKIWRENQMGDIPEKATRTKTRNHRSSYLLQYKY